jgi:hypothetical protein
MLSHETGTGTMTNSPQFMFLLPQTDVKLFRNITATQQDQLTADFTAAVATRERAVTGATQDNKARAWGRLEKYCQSIGCSNFYMDRLGNQEKWLSNPDDSWGKAMGHWLREQSEVSSHMWYRPSG